MAQNQQTLSAAKRHLSARIHAELKDKAVYQQIVDKREGFNRTPTLLKDPDVDWKENAPCRNQTAWFFPGSERSTPAHKAACGACLLQQKCLDNAIANNEPSGIWGGFDRRERQAIKRARAAKKRARSRG